MRRMLKSNDRGILHRQRCRILLHRRMPAQTLHTRRTDKHVRWRKQRQLPNRTRRRWRRRILEPNQTPHAKPRRHGQTAHHPRNQQMQTNHTRRERKTNEEDSRVHERRTGERETPRATSKNQVRPARPSLHAHTREQPAEKGTGTEKKTTVEKAVKSGKKKTKKD